MPTKISKTYVPLQRKYMCAKHKAYFRKALAEWKDELVEQNNRIIFGNDDDNAASADVVDQATSFTNKSVEMRTVNRHKKLMKKIDLLKKIDDGTYGYCTETGEEIGLKDYCATYSNNDC